MKGVLIMDLEKIEKLMKMFEDSSMLEFSYTEGETEVYMNRKGEVGEAVAPVAIVANEEAMETPEEVPEEQYILSPIVATFYSAPAPDAKPFVTVGDKIKVGDTVCILEAMKLLNEIESDYDCEIEAVLVSNGQKVEYGQPLFRIKLEN